MYDPNKVLANASLYGLGGVLLQKWKEEWKPIAYALWLLTPTEVQGFSHWKTVLPGD